MLIKRQAANARRSKLAPGVKLWVLKNFWQRFSKPIQREAAIEAAREATRRALSAERDVFLQQALENDGKRVADAARRKIDGDSVSKLANEGEEAEAQRVADEFNKKAEQRANQAAERAGDLYDGGADPGKAADVATDEATQDAFHREAAEQGRPMPGMKGAGVGPVAGEHARNNVKDALPESAVEEHAGKGVPVDYGLESAKGTAIEKASDKTKKALDIQQDDPTKKDE